MVRALLVLVALGGVAHAETWHTYAAFRNDAFSELIPPLNDTGFTHDTAFSLHRADGDYAFGGGLLDRWITSTRDRRRWDQLDLVALGERRWPYRITTAARLGPTLGGNFGGRYLQNGWHALSETGPTVDEGLANNYVDGRRIGVLAGARGRIAIGDDLDTLGRPIGLQAHAVIDGQISYGGVTSFEVATGGTASTRHVGVLVELAIARYHVGDPNLALPGGYGTGFQLEWRAGIHVAWSRFRLSYQYRANESGSGEPIGVVAFEARR